MMARSRFVDQTLRHCSVGQWIKIDVRKIPQSDELKDGVNVGSEVEEFGC